MSWRRATMGESIAQLTAEELERIRDMTIDPRALVGHLMQLAPKSIAPWCSQRARCVLATAVGLAVLDHFGVEARPLALGASIYNRTWIEWVDAHGSIKSNEDGEAVLAAGGWAIEYDPRRTADPGHWHGHLVIEVPALAALVDLDFQQFSRPHKDMVFPDAMAFAWPAGTLRQSYRLEGGAAILIEAQPDNVRWRSSRDWRRVQRGECRHIIGPLIRVTRQAMESAA